jgi:hypothetical protein
MNKRVVFISSALTILLLTLSVPLLQRVDRARGGQALQDVLYVPSPQTIKKLSLGYNGLMADIYWTRVVQYFGGKHYLKSREYLLLGPLLDITTTLDPQLIVAYQFGATFLAQNPPEGAGDPRAAVRLAERGIQNNPQAWRLYYQLGFIYWQELHDPHAASDAFLKGSQVPGALPWMKVMAAALAQSGGERETARYLWTNILHDSEDQLLRSNAIKRLRALDSDQAVEVLQREVDRYKAEHGTAPNSWGDLIAARQMHGVPRDPMGNLYVLRSGRVEVADPDNFPFITQGLPPGKEPSVIPKMAGK